MRNNKRNNLPHGTYGVLTTRSTVAKGVENVNKCVQNNIFVKTSGLDII